MTSRTFDLSAAVLCQDADRLAHFLRRCAPVGDLCYNSPILEE